MKTQRQIASDFLTEILSEPKSAIEVLSEAHRRGIKVRTLKRAKASLQIRSIKTGGRGSPWMWHRT